MHCARTPQFTEDMLAVMAGQCAYIIGRLGHTESITHVQRLRATYIIEHLPEQSVGNCVGCEANNASTKPLLGLHLCYRHARSVLWPNK